MQKQKKNKLATFLNSITKLGIEEKHSQKEKKRIVLFNIGCIVWYCITLIQITYYSLFTSSSFIKVVFSLTIISIVCIAQIIHTKQSFYIGRILYLFCLIVTSVILSNFYRQGILLEFFLLLVPSISLLYFDDKFTNRVFFVVALLCFALPNIYFQNYPTIKLYSLGMICLFFSIYMIINYFKKENNKSENLLALERDKVLSDKIILQKQEAKLRELNEFKTHFFVNLSHEIRTPITLIKGYTSKIDFKAPKEDNEHKLHIVKNQINQIEDILNSILDLSKLDENKLTLNRTEVSLISFVKKHYADFKNLFDKKNITFELTYNVTNLQINIDNRLLSKALNNLLNNALKFTKENGNVCIEIYCKKHLYIKVIDNGIGIPEDDLVKVFDRFYQSKNDITKSQGSGIGLSFAKSILEAHGFSINVKSKPDNKTIFTIKIPKEFVSIEKQTEVVQLPKLTNKTVTTLPVSQIQPTKNETILIVDDHEELRYYLKTILKDYNLLEAENGKQALEIIKNNTIDMVVTDYMMPEMDGKELVVEIKRLNIIIPIIILTARVDDFARLDLLRIGVDSYMIKPFIEEELVLTVQNSISTYKNIVKNQTQLTPEEKKELDEGGAIFYKNIRDVIENNIDNFNFGVEDIALFFDISKRTLNRKVKTILGQTAKDLIIQSRLEKARELQLSSPKMTKKEIAHSVGINNSNYLIKKMAKRFGNHYNP